jgi:hypothetical protein
MHHKRTPREEALQRGVGEECGVVCAEGVFFYF